ncbi:MAG: hypothetical protein V4722_24470 [Bacteroidota bacterium]
MENSVLIWQETVYFPTYHIGEPGEIPVFLRKDDTSIAEALCNHMIDVPEQQNETGGIKKSEYPNPKKKTAGICITSIVKPVCHAYRLQCRAAKQEHHATVNNCVHQL